MEYKKQPIMTEEMKIELSNGKEANEKELFEPNR